MSETAKFVKVMLPGASFFEKRGTFTHGERRVQRVNEVIPPLAGTKTDGQRSSWTSRTAWASSGPGMASACHRCPSLLSATAEN